MPECDVAYLSWKIESKILQLQNNLVDRCGVRPVLSASGRTLTFNVLNPDSQVADRRLGRDGSDIGAMC